MTAIQHRRLQLWKSVLVDLLALFLYVCPLLGLVLIFRPQL